MTASNKTLLQIVNNAQGLLGLPQSSSVVGNTTDFSAIQMLAIANEAGEELRDWPEQGWIALQSEFDLVVSPPITTTGILTENSAVITNISPNTTGIIAGIYVASGNSIPQNARVSTVDSSTQITLSMEATGSATGETLTFAQDTYPLPTDLKAFIGDTWWDRTNHWRLFGPDSPQMDQWHRSGIVATGPRRHFRIIGHLTDTFRIWPPPFEIINPLQFAMEYNSTDFVNVGGTNTSTASSFQGDTDTTYLDDRALIKMLTWKYNMFKGLAYSTLRNDAVDFINTLLSRDGASKPLSLAAVDPSLLLTPFQIQDGFFPSGPSTVSGN